ncbi:flagellin [Rhizobiaceae bacterium BDR2-2]|uniref:Flagellin n=1 Tax=Ectorhizobium quercum TaxID=2965071 RepID=A0AAE3N266_9HYPH|nr:flagellin [Ectorhizobium quercum]MCX8996115.1 flagellin [Ectorhizobium quercum]MCX8998846.1 flagellin [Ectorhizobium quercum]
MTSIITNIPAMSALQTLRAINSNLEATQDRVSSGYRVSEAKDNVAYWSISTTMNSDNKALGAAIDALGVGAAKVDVAYAGVESAIDVVNEIKAKLVSASETSTDNDQIQLEIEKLQEQLRSIAEGASFSGENWLTGRDGSDNPITTGTVVDGFIRQGSSVLVTTADVDLEDIIFFGDVDAGTGGILGDVNGITLESTDDLDDIDAYLTIAENTMTALNKAGATLGALSTRIDLQDTFASKLSDSIESGVSRLVDADMEEESAKLSALQTQQQLAIQSLSIANTSAQNILTLFRQ